jgi:hypothetical protein
MLKIPIKLHAFYPREIAGAKNFVLRDAYGLSEGKVIKFQYPASDGLEFSDYIKRIDLEEGIEIFKIKNKSSVFASTYLRENWSTAFIHFSVANNAQFNLRFLKEQLSPKLFPKQPEE